MKYDPTLRALLTPERGAPLPDFSIAWERDPICAELARLAYVRFEKRDKPRLAKALADAGFVGEPECFHSKRTGAQAFGTAAPDGTIYIAFRGTHVTSIKDLLTDLAAIKVRWPGKGRVHWGFWTAYRSISGAIDRWLEQYPAPPLVVTGHSLGAAMATLMAVLHPRADLVTFGAPRVGDRAFVDQLAARAVRRYVDCVDAIPRLPPPIGYAHVQEMVYIDHRGELHSPPPDRAALREDRRAARRIYRRKHAWRFGNVPSRSGADHAPVNYVSALLSRREGV